MQRYTRVAAVTFGQIELPLPLSVRVTRRAQAYPLAGDADAFATSVQIAAVETLLEVRLHGTATAETLTPGQVGTLSFQVQPTRSGQAARQVTLGGAVLISVEIDYPQSAPAVATLRFACEAADGSTDPFSAEDVQ